MRHRKSGRILGRKSPHRKAMFSNMVASLVEHGTIKTTEAKAKELRRVADRAINWGVKVADIQGKAAKDRSSDESNQLVHARRQCGKLVRDRDALDQLFTEVAPRFTGRNGGYTRVLKAPPRTGDAAPMAYVQLVELG
ncbi:MAG: 50S ribosomal protein L17 [Deltaproteobacteria bacterium]|nr:50S ribosomal protein L17 [Deltaproteobacteria bacterium]